LVVGVRGTGPNTGWWVLGAAATSIFAMTWRQFAAAQSASSPHGPMATPAFDADAWMLIGCYGTFGFGYIIPATFLPSLARDLLADPAIFGWIWPVFGTAAAASTIAASLLLCNAAPRKVWAVCQVAMAVGVAAPAIAPNIGMLLVAAIATGGTFVVLTMAGMQEARRVAGSAAPRLIAAMTAAFALGQLLGPIVVSVFSSTPALRGPSIAAAVALVAGAAILTASRRPRDAFSSI
jgi:MFS family permease